MEKARNLVMGIWKFSDVVSEQELIDLATEWAKDEKYLNVYVRGTSKDQNGIGFTYRCETESEKEMEDFFYTVSDMLKRKFGNDLVGWDINKAPVLIKG